MEPASSSPPRAMAITTSGWKPLRRISSASPRDARWNASHVSTSRSIWSVPASPASKVMHSRLATEDERSGHDDEGDDVHDHRPPEPQPEARLLRLVPEHGLRDDGTGPASEHGDEVQGRLGD